MENTTINQMKETFQDGVDNIYNAGYSAGNSAGYNSGYSAGFVAGKATGGRVRCVLNASYDGRAGSEDDNQPIASASATLYLPDERSSSQSVRHCSGHWITGTQDMWHFT